MSQITTDQWEAILRVRRAAGLDDVACATVEWDAFSQEWGRHLSEQAAHFDPGAREYLACQVNAHGWQAGDMKFYGADKIEPQLDGSSPHLWHAGFLRIANNVWSQYFLLDVSTGQVWAMPSLCVAPVFTDNAAATMSREEVLAELNTAVDFVFDSVQVFMLTVEDMILNPDDD
jgi:hypothetical protein